MRAIATLIGILSSVQLHAAPSATVGKPCADAKVQAQRSQELQKIRAADQADRAWQVKGEQPDTKTLEKMSKNDLVRRMRVGEILGEGCLATAADYEAAFMVYQHGNTSDQYFQAYVWAKQAVSLGNPHLKAELAMAVDRYLVSTGHKQLFGTQASQNASTGGCWCIQEIEKSFPEKLRDEYRGGGNAAYTGLAYLKTLNAGKNCPVDYCDIDLQASPQGTLPGFW